MEGMCVKFDVIGLDSPCVDLAVNVRCFPKPNGAERIQNLSWQGGGKVASGMVAAARLGLCCGIMGNVGDDKYGTFCLRDFQDHGIDTEQMCVRKNRTTNFDIVISDEGSMGRSFVFYPGNAECMTEEELNIEYISNSSYFYMANLDSVTKKAAQMAKQKGSKIFMDADSYTSYKNAMREIQSSLMNLETDYIDFYFVHWPDVNTPIDETMAALEEMKRKGYIRYVGVSNFTAEQIKEAEQYIQIDVQQPLYSMVDRGFEDLMSWGYDRGIDSMTYGSMGAGILSGKIRSVPSFEKNDLRLNFYDVYKEPKFSKIMELLKVMDSIADGHNVPVGQVALNWSTQKEYVGTALVGVRSIEHADENCKTFDWKLTEEEMKILDSKIEECAL